MFSIVTFLNAPSFARRMKVAMLSSMYLRNPTDTRGLMVSEFNRLLKKEGHKVEVVAPGDVGIPSEDEIEGIKIHRFTYFLPKSLQKLAYGPGIPTNLSKSWLARFQVPFFALSFLAKAFKHTKGVDLIHCQWIPPGLIGLLVNKIRKKPLVVTVRRVESGKIMKPITRYVLKNADLVLFNSTYTEKESVAIAQPKKSMVLHNSLDTEKFSPLPQERLNKLREDNHIPREANILLFLGLLVEKKGINYLIEAMAAVLKQYPDTYLIIAGHGSEEQKLKDMVTRFRIQDKVIFTGHVDAKTTPTYFNLADVFVCPSIIDSKGDTETLGVVVLEALSCETPVVASRIGGVPDILTPDCGILVPQKDPLALHEAICDLLKDKKKREVMGIAGRKRVVEHFGEDAIRARLRQAYALVIPSQNNAQEEYAHV